MSNENTNMALWDSVCRTDPAITKGAKIGAMNITAISPQHQRKKATEIFGPYGTGWGIEPESEKFTFNSFGDTTLVSYSAVMFYKYNATDLEVDGIKTPALGRFPINAVVKVAYMTQSYKDKPGYMKVDDEYTKKVQTNALTKGLSALGFNSDVFEGKFDDCKYVAQITQEFAAEKNAEQLAKWNAEKISSSDRQKLGALVKSMNYSPESISKYLLEAYKIKSSTEITNGDIGDIIKAITDGKINDNTEKAQNANT